MKNLNSGGNKSGKVRKTRLKMVGDMEQYKFDYFNKVLKDKITITNSSQTRFIKVKEVHFDNRGNIYITADEL